MLRIGVTGGVGCGKTEVTDSFRKFGVPVIDSDQITRELVVKDSPVLQEIVELFGKDILRPEGGLDRRKLREIVFNETTARKKLEQILHPRVRQEINRQSKTCSEKHYCLIVIPLLVETHMIDMVDRVLVVDCEEHQQIKRVIKRDKVTKKDVQAIIATQTTRPARLAWATDTIQNTGALAELQSQVLQLHHHFIGLSHL